MVSTHKQPCEPRAIERQRLSSPLSPSVPRYLPYAQSHNLVNEGAEALMTAMLGICEPLIKGCNYNGSFPQIDDDVTERAAEWTACLNACKASASMHLTYLTELAPFAAPFFRPLYPALVFG